MPSAKNKAYRLLIDRVIYDREDYGIILEVLYKKIKMSLHPEKPAKILY